MTDFRRFVQHLANSLLLAGNLFFQNPFQEE